MGAGHLSGLSKEVRGVMDHTAGSAIMRIVTVIVMCAAAAATSGCASEELEDARVAESVSMEPWGETTDGTPVARYTLTNSNGMVEHPESASGVRPGRAPRPDRGRLHAPWAPPL